MDFQQQNFHPLNGRQVEKIMKEIKEYINKGTFERHDVIAALCGILIVIGLEFKLNKGHLLNYLSNSWEINDLLNDHPDVGDCERLNL